MSPASRHRSAAAAVAAVALVLAVTAGGCTGEADEAPTPGTGTSAAPSTTVTTTVTAGTPTTVTRDDGDDGGTDGTGGTAPAFPADVGADTGEGSGAPLLFKDLRIGHHDGFDRVVWEFAGAGAPGWRVEYVEGPTRDPSGLPVDLPGEATLQVVITNLGYPGDVDAPGAEFYAGPEVMAAGSTEWVTQVIAGDLFEGQLTGFVGVTRQVPFRVYALDDPARVVLDVSGP
jgi:hypothetical protein